MLTDAPRSAAGEAVLQIQGLSKTFGGTHALIDVDLDIRPDEIHALVGHNGLRQVDADQDARRLPPPGPRCTLVAGRRRGAISGLPTSARPRPPAVRAPGSRARTRARRARQPRTARGLREAASFGRIRWAEQERAAQAAARTLRSSTWTCTGRSSAATPVERVIVAIVAAVQGWEGGRGVLVLDEPTAVLPPHEVAELFV